MTTIELLAKIKAEIERLKGIGGIVPLDNREQKTGYESALIDIETFLSTLEESEKLMQEGLEEEIKRWLKEGEITDTRYDDYDDNDIEATARHFAQWVADKLLGQIFPCTAEATQEKETGLINVTVKVSPYLAPTILLDKFTKKIFTDNIIKELQREYDTIRGEGEGRSKSLGGNRPRPRTPFLLAQKVILGGKTPSKNETKWKD